jgi:hypothetical protein
VISDADAADVALDACEEASGERPDGCPWAALNTPFVLEVIRARNWHDAGELAERYPDGVPNIIVWAIDVYDAAFNGVQVHDMREDREKREEEQRERDANKPTR